MNTSATQTKPKTRLLAHESYQLARFLDEHRKEASQSTLREITDSAGQHLDFKVTENNVRTALAATGIQPLPARRPATQAHNKLRTLARVQMAIVEHIGLELHPITRHALAAISEAADEAPPR